jgi:hypothetical protein
MPRPLWLWCALALLPALAAPASAQDPAIPPASEKDLALAAWARDAEPGPWHAFLARRAGKWNVAGRTWNDPEGEPALSTAESSLEMILGGRFLQERLKGQSGGQKYEGLGLLGCDNADSTVTAVWVDGMNTLTSVLSGPAGEPGQPLELRGRLTDPASGRVMHLRVVITWVSADEHWWEYFGAPEGFDEARILELVYTRR